MPQIPLRRDVDYGEHGVARPLYAGDVTRRLQPARLPARRQRRYLAGRAPAAEELRGLDPDRGKGARGRHAGEARARASRLSHGILARLRRCRRGALRASEPDVEREKVVEPAQVDLRAEEIVAGPRRPQIAYGVLPPDLEARRRAPDWKADAAEDDRADRRASDRVHLAAADRAVRQDEVSCLTVAPGVDAHSCADVRLYRRVVSEGQRPERGRERHGSHFEIRSDVEAILVDEITIDGPRAPLVVANTRTRLEIVAERR